MQVLLYNFKVDTSPYNHPLSLLLFLPHSPPLVPPLLILVVLLLVLPFLLYLPPASLLLIPYHQRAHLGLVWFSISTILFRSCHSFSLLYLKFDLSWSAYAPLFCCHSSQFSVFSSPSLEPFVPRLFLATFNPSKALINLGTMLSGRLP